MLEFASRHRIVPWVESGKLDLKGIQEGVDRLRKGFTRYRYTILFISLKTSGLSLLQRVYLLNHSLDARVLRNVRSTEITAV